MGYETSAGNHAETHRQKDSSKKKMAKVVGNYELNSDLGSGAFAVVFRSRHLRTGKHYAIKSISKGTGCDSQIFSTG